MPCDTISEATPSALQAWPVPTCHFGTQRFGASWKPTQQTYIQDPRALDDELARSTPTNAQLTEWAARSELRPPQAWYDDDADPFAPANNAKA